MRPTLPSLLALAALAATAVAAPPAGTPAPAAPVALPSTLADLRARADQADERLLKIVAEAAMNPYLKRVRMYAAYPDTVLSDSRRGSNGGVTVNELFDIVEGHETADIREEAANAITAEHPLTL